MIMFDINSILNFLTEENFMKTVKSSDVKGAKRRITKEIAIPAPVKKELNSWLATRSGWNHEEWLGLLDNLRRRGYDNLVNNPTGQATIGSYLENNR